MLAVLKKFEVTKKKMNKKTEQQLSVWHGQQKRDKIAQTVLKLEI